MGNAMAHNLLKAGFALSVWNRTAAKMESLVTAGASGAAHPAEVAANSDVVVVCVGDTADVEQVVLGADGIATGAAAGSLVIDCSTISPAATRRIAAELAARDVAMLDAPVSGGSEGAAAGTLSIMVGGPQAAFDRVLPVFERMGKNITLVGGNGDGQTTWHDGEGGLNQARAHMGFMMKGEGLS